MEQIKQIVPATDWRAVFIYRDEDTGEMELEVPPRCLGGE